MNILTQVCSIIITSILLVFYYRRKQIYTFSNKIFERMLITLMISLIFEISFIITAHVAVNAGYYSSDTNTFLSPYSCSVFILVKGYLISLVLLTMFTYDYDVVDVSFKLNNHVFIRFLVCITIALLPIKVYVEDDFVGLGGLGSLISLVIVAFIVGLATKTIVRHKQKINKVKYICVNIWLVIWLIASVLQYTQNLYLVTFSCVVGIFILFYEIENPDAKIDKKTGFFVSHFIFDYVKTLRNTGVSAHIGVIYSKGGKLDVSVIRALMGKNYYSCFKDTDYFTYVISYNYDLLKNFLINYKKQQECSVILYEPIVDIANLKLFLNYIKRKISDWSCYDIYNVTDEDIQSLIEDDKMQLEIINALMENRVVTYIQPIYDLKSMKIVSGECLCRLKRRNGDIIEPRKFIPVAERTNLIVDIETTMFRNMCDCLSAIRLLPSDIKYLEANLSVKKGEQHNLAEEYSDILKEYKIPAYMINLEITETDVIAQKISILNNMNRMRELGFEFSLDDFGTGESNLGYIIDMPVSIIKFDREITQKAMVDDKALIVVKNVIKMVHELHIKVVVEGVETKDDVAVCEKMGVDYVQGYYFSKPLPMDAFIDFATNFEKIS